MMMKASIASIAMLVSYSQAAGDYSRLETYTVDELAALSANGVAFEL